MEQEQTFVNPAEGGKITETSYGKFSGPEELLKAYNALESEFTRRSQRLKEYEKTYGETGRSIEEQKQELTRRFNVSPELIDEAARRAESETNERMELSLIGVLSEKVLSPEQMAADSAVVDKVLSEEKNREAVINGYIEKIKKINAPVAFPAGGESPAIAPYRPTTVAEAGEIAKAIFEQIK
ncbi:MAG: hypothetical protein ACI4M8_01885 [Christensenellales bacterium]